MLPGAVMVALETRLCLAYLTAWRFILQEISSGFRFPVVSVVSGVSCHSMSFQ